MSGWASGVGTCWGRGWSGGGSYLVRGAALGAITSLGRWGVGVKPNRPPGRRAEGFSSPTHPEPSLVREATPSLPTPPNAGLPGPPPSAYPVDQPTPLFKPRSLARSLAGWPGRDCVWPVLAPPPRPPFGQLGTQGWRCDPKFGSRQLCRVCYSLQTRSLHRPLRRRAQSRLSSRALARARR